MVVGIYGRSPLFRLIERKNLSPHWPSLVELYGWAPNFCEISLASFGPSRVTRAGGLTAKLDLFHSHTFVPVYWMGV